MMLGIFVLGRFTSIPFTCLRTRVLSDGYDATLLHTLEWTHLAQLTFP